MERIMEIQGIITKKVMKKTQAGATYATFTINGKNYNSFDKDIIEKYNDGNNVLIKTKTSGNFENMVSMESVGEVPVEKLGEAYKAAPAGDPALRNKPKEFHLTEESCRAEAMKCALKSYELMKINKWNTSDLFVLADQMLVYIKGGAE